uniref:Ig-like domain-containing protein n=1 Tax=Strongyloides papillosus TaxID=174720 RepID=A0A0N5BXZ4_STREA
MVKLFWILAVYSVYISLCDEDFRKYVLERAREFEKHFRYHNYKDIHRSHREFPRKHTITTNAEIIAIKCPIEHRKLPSTFPGLSKIIGYEKPKNFVEDYIHIKKDGSYYEWRIYSIGKVEEIKITCLNIYEGYHEGTALKFRFIREWDHMISRTKESKISITHRLNVTSRPYESKTFNINSTEKIYVFDKNLRYKRLYGSDMLFKKGDILAIFHSEKFNSGDIEFLEPISITKIYHAPPFFNIDINSHIARKINEENKEWWFVGPINFPFRLYVFLDYTNRDRNLFFQKQNITLSHLKYSKDNKLEEIKKEILELENFYSLHLSEPTILKLHYYCDDCIDGGIDVIQKVIFGKTFDFKSEILSSVEYFHNKLNFKANCSVNLSDFTQLKTASFNDEKIEVQDLHWTNGNSIGHFRLENGVVIFQNKNPIGILYCTYIYPIGEFHTSQTYKSFKDEEMPPITYLHDELLFKPNCSMDQGKSVSLKTILFNEERIEIYDLQGTNDQEKGNFKLIQKFAIFRDRNPKGKLSCIYELHNTTFLVNQTYEYFENTNLSDIKYASNQLSFKANCSLEPKSNVNLKNILFDDKSAEIEDLQKPNNNLKGNFKLDGKYAIFTDTNPNGRLSCTYKLTVGNVSVYQSYKYFKTIGHPAVKYASESNVNLKTILFNNESTEINDLKNTVSNSKEKLKLDTGFIYFMGNNPKGKWTCVYKLHVGEIKTSQEYELIENRTLPDVRYAHGQLNFNPNCSRKENDFTQLKTIILNDKRIEVEGLDDAALSQIENLNSTKKLLLYTVKNPEGKFICIYKVPIGEIEKSQNYKPILNETLSVVYSFNELGYKANCSVNLNNYTNLKHISFKDDKIEFRFLKLRKFQERGRLKLEKDFVINTENNPNGTLHCLYDVPIGEVLVKKEFKTFRIDNGQISRNKIGVMGSMILIFVIVVNIMILII